MTPERFDRATVEPSPGTTDHEIEPPIGIEVADDRTVAESATNAHRPVSTSPVPFEGVDHPGRTRHEQIVVTIAIEIGPDRSKGDRMGRASRRLVDPSGPLALHGAPEEPVDPGRHVDPRPANTQTLG